MAGATVVAILSIVLIFMASNALCGCALIHTVLMTFLAFQLRMLSHKRKSSVVVIEVYIAPAIWGVAGTTICAKLPIMLVIVGVAGITVLRCTLEYSIYVTGLALDVFMSPGQCEARVIVIEAHILPCRRFMTGATIGPKLAVVCIIRGMAGITIPGRALVGIIRMARFTGHSCVRAGQGEGRIIMVERGVLPTGRVMTGGTIRAKLTGMRIIRCMAGITVL